MASKIQPLMNGLANGETRAESLGKLIAEYQALSRRQANHGGIWRLFHLTENAERTTLLKEMEQTIKKELVNILDIDVDTADPADIARAVEETLQNKRFRSQSKLYKRDIGSVYGFNEYILNPNRLDDVNAELEIEKILKENEKDYNLENGIVNDEAEVVINDNDEINNNVIDNNVANNEFIGSNELNESIASDNSQKDNDVQENNNDVQEQIQEQVQEQIQEQNNIVIEESIPEEHEIQNSNQQVAEESNKTKCENLIGNNTFMVKLGDDAWKAISDKVGRDVEKDEVIGEILNSMTNAALSINESYDDINVDGVSGNELESLIHDDMVSIYTVALNSLESCQMNVQDRVIAAQKLTDVILNKLTVVGFNNDKYAKYGNNYAVADPTIVKETLEAVLEDLSEYTVNAVIGNARRELNVIAFEDVQKKEDVKEEIKEEQPVEESIVEESIVEESIVEEPIVEEPIVEEPIVEQVIIEESNAKESVVAEPEKEPNYIEIARDFFVGII